MTGQTARLFAGLELPTPAQTALAQWGGKQLGGLAGVRLVPPDALHVTLCFLGSRPVAEVEAITAACDRLGGSRPARLRCGDAVWLPPRRPGVVAIGLEDLDGRLSELQSHLAGLLAAGDWYAPERRPFLAHVTVARLARHARVRPFELPAPSRVRFLATQITLFSSWPGALGVRYERLATVRLTPAGSPSTSRTPDRSRRS